MSGLDRTKYMDLEEIRRLQTVTQAKMVMDLQAGRKNGVTAWMLVDLALLTGLRVSEMADLKVGDINLKRGSLTIRRAKKKNRVSETLAISKELVDHLRKYLEWKKLLEHPQTADSPLFIGGRGALSAQGLQRIWKAAIQRAGLPEELSIHSARHTLAVHLLKKTGNLRQVQKQLGHASPATTANMYADISFEDMQDGLQGIYNQ